MSPTKLLHLPVLSLWFTVLHKFLFLTFSLSTQHYPLVLISDCFVLLAWFYIVLLVVILSIAFPLIHKVTNDSAHTPVSDPWPPEVIGA